MLQNNKSRNYRLPTLKEIIKYGYENSDHNIRLYSPALKSVYFKLSFLYDEKRSPKTYLSFEEIEVNYKDNNLEITYLKCFISSFKQAQEQIRLALEWYKPFKDVNNEDILIPDAVTFLRINNRKNKKKYSDIKLSKYFKNIIKEQLMNNGIKWNDLTDLKKVDNENIDAICEWLTMEKNKDIVMNIYEMLDTKEGIRDLYKDGIPDEDKSDDDNDEDKSDEDKSDED